MASCYQLYCKQQSTTVPVAVQPAALAVAGLLPDFEIAHVGASVYSKLVGVRSHVLLDVRVPKQFKLLSLLYYFQNGYNYQEATAVRSDGDSGLAEMVKNFSIQSFPLGGSGFQVNYTVYCITWQQPGGAGSPRCSLYLVNIPLADMQLNARGSNAARVATVKASIAGLRRCGQDLCGIDVAGDNVGGAGAGADADADAGAGAGAVGEQLPVYVICRRGVDSVTATQCLTDFFGVSGGAGGVANVSGGLNNWRVEVDPALPEY